MLLPFRFLASFGLCLVILFTVGPFTHLNQACWAQDEDDMDDEAIEENEMQNRKQDDSESQEEEDEMKWLGKIDPLMAKLESANLEERDQAEKEMIGLGPKALDYLEPPEGLSSDAGARLGRVRTELEKISVVKSTQATTVKLRGEKTVEEILESIQKQTENQIVYERVPRNILDKSISVDWDGVEFWKVIYELIDEADLEIDSFAGVPGKLSLMISRAAVAETQPDGEEVLRPSDIPRASVGLFDFSVTQVSSAINMIKPEQDTTSVLATIRWEPRLQPISLDIHYKTIVAKDDQGRELKVKRAEESVFYGATSPETTELEFSIPFELVDRKVKTIKSIEAEMIAVLPGRRETFRLKKLSTLKEGAEYRKAGAILTYGGIEKNEDLFGVTLTLSFDESFNSLESHRGWAYDNPMFLEGENGKKLSPITFEGLRQSENSVAVRYYFEEDPANYALVYKTIAAIVKHPVKLQLNNIDLP